jgi:uncharacterized HAD superfamily protein
MRIGLDIDGVFYKFTKAYHLWLNQTKGMSLDLEIEAQTWDWFLDWETSEEFVQNLHESVDARQMYWVGELYEPDMAQNLRDLRSAGHSIHFVTARLFGKQLCPEAATKHWLESEDLVYDTLTVSKDKNAVKTDVFLEDNLNNYDLLEAAGVQSWLVNRPYNLENDSRRRINSVDEFTKLILEGKCSLLESSAAYSAQ